MKIPYETLATPGQPTPWAATEPTAEKEWAALWLQGWESTIESQYEAAARVSRASGISFAMIDYAGFGEHTAPLEETTRQQQFLGVVAAYDALKERGYENVIAVGYSFGGYMSALLSRERELAAIILRAPAIYDDSEFTIKQKDRDGETYQAFKESVQPSSQLLALEAIRQYDKPVYVLEQGEDEVIPENIPRSYFANAQQGNYFYIPGAPHSPSDLPDARPYYDYIESIVTNTINLVQKEAALLRS